MTAPQAALWIALKKLGVPIQTVTLIKSFQKDMEAQIHLDGKLLEEIKGENGLRQGGVAWHQCCLICIRALFWNNGMKR